MPSRRLLDSAQENPRGGPGLTMSRSLGDLDADPVGVIPTPEVSFRPVQMGRDKFVVLASDGLFEFISNETVVEVRAHKMRLACGVACDPPLIDRLVLCMNRWLAVA